ncbi:FecCD family ABC transporter permease [Amycolatopsis magusensis]|uniref:FecCD family ABC transporter permease n=1 Tax=Amycolatopsis magusensis TaxID=882444 RepID=UPI003C2FB507
MNALKNSAATRILRAPGGRISLRVPTRAVIVCAVLAIAVAIVSVVSLTTGDYKLSVPEVVATLFGQGPPGADFIVTTLRLPRLLAALLVGAALAVSGAILQSLSGNPLGSPDIIGFSHGSATGALIVIITTTGGMLETALGALLGGMVTAIVVYLLAFKRGMHGLRMVLIGVGVSSMLLSANSYLITRASLQDAVSAQAWQVGGLNGRGWEHVQPVAIALAVLLPIAAYYGRRLSMLEMGDDAAKGLGVPVERSRLVLFGVSVTLCAVATAAAGPITFLALAGPQLARKLTRAAGPNLLASALMGAFLLVASDLGIQRLFPSQQLPVGIATGVLGGGYLAWLLAVRWRARS